MSVHVRTLLCLPGPASASSMSQPGEVEVLAAPEDVYADFLEAYLLLTHVRLAFLACRGYEPPAALGMMARNDLLLWVMEQIYEPWRSTLCRYADALACTFSHQRHPTLPLPRWPAKTAVSEAESLALHFLDAGHVPLWNAVRQVVNLLHRESPRHKDVAPGTASSATFGVYATGPFAGLCKLTLTHPNVTRLLNCFITRLCPYHRWTTVAVLFNYQLSRHKDHGNAVTPSLVTSLSLHEDGEIWIENPEGTAISVHEGVPRLGSRYSLQLQAVRFQAHRMLHRTCEWTSFDRVVVSAYAVSRWETLQMPWQEQLADLGFYLPDRTVQVRQPRLHDDCLPCVVR